MWISSVNKVINNYWLLSVSASLTHLHSHKAECFLSNSHNSLCVFFNSLLSSHVLLQRTLYLQFFFTHLLSTIFVISHFCSLSAAFWAWDCEESNEVMALRELVTAAILWLSSSTIHPHECWDRVTLKEIEQLMGSVIGSVVWVLKQLCASACFLRKELWKTTELIFNFTLVALIELSVLSGFSSSSLTTRGLSEACQRKGLKADQKDRGLILTSVSLTELT